MKRRYVAFVLVLCLILSIPATALAAQESRMIQLLQAEPGKLSILLTSQEEQGEYSATLDGKELSLTGGTVLQESVPITVYCLVDTSDYLNDFKMKLIQDTLTQISRSMSSGDQMVITTVSGEIREGATLTTESDRTAAIAAIPRSEKTDSNLYSGIVYSLDRLASAKDMNPMRSLVVFSLVSDVSPSDHTEQEVKDAIARTNVPVYTIGLIEHNKQLDGNKVLGSFARASCGGFHQSTLKSESDHSINRDASGVDFGAAIWKNITNCQFLSAEVSNALLDTSKTEAKLTVTFASSKNVYSDSTTVTTTNLALPEETTEPTTEPTSEPTTEPTSEPTTEPATESATEPPEPDPDNRLYLWIIAAVLAAAVIVAVVIIAARKKPQPQPPVIGERIVNPKPACYLEMVDIPHGKHAKRFVVPYNEPVTFGRTKQAKYILDDSDPQLSGLHFTLVVQPDSIRVRDERSTNGTFINGVSIAGNGWKQMRSGEKLRAGSREYRISVIDENA